MSIEILTVLMFGSILVGLILGVPVSFSLGGVSIIFIFFMWGADALYMVSSITFGLMSNYYLLCIPLFIFMANMLAQSGVMDDLYTMMHQWAANLKGGLAIGTVLICTVFAAMVGLGGMAVVTLGLIALPEMLKREYDSHLSMGCILAGSALGNLIPPSLTLILYGIMASVSIGQLFMGGAIPGLLLSFLFILYIVIRSALQPHLAPSPPKEAVLWSKRVTSLRAVILPILLVVGVLGSIFAGVCTATEAASIGAFGSIICAAIYRRLGWQGFKEASYTALRLTVMVFWILIGASCFISIYTGVGAQQFVGQVLAGLPFGRWGILIIMQLILIFLGCFMDPGGIVMITIPVFLPVIKILGFDPLWFGVIFAMNLLMGYLTPPFGFNLFFMKGVVPKNITMQDIYYAALPYVGLQALGLAIVMIVPQLALWLPGLMFK